MRTGSFITSRLRFLLQFWWVFADSHRLKSVHHIISIVTYCIITCWWAVPCTISWSNLCLHFGGQVIPADHDLKKMLQKYEENREKILMAHCWINYLRQRWSYQAIIMSALKRPLCNCQHFFFFTWNWVYKHSSFSGQLIYIVGFLN